MKNGIVGHLKKIKATPEQRYEIVQARTKNDNLRVWGETASEVLSGHLTGLKHSPSKAIDIRGGRKGLNNKLMTNVKGVNNMTAASKEVAAD